MLGSVVSPGARHNLIGVDRKMKGGKPTIKTLEFAMISPGKAEKAANSRSRISRKAWLELDWALV